MSEWRYLAQRLNGNGTGTFLDHAVPLTDVGIELSLSSPDVLEASISPEAQRLKAPDGRPLFEEWSTAIYAEKDGDIRFGGILADSTFGKSEWGLTCVGFMGYANEMPYTGPGQFFVNTDTLDIVRAIWGHIQAQPRGDIGLHLDSKLSGRRVGSTLASEEYDPEGGSGGLTLESQAYKLAWYQDFDLLGNIHKLAEETPFDYRERHRWNDQHTDILHRIEFGVPTLGRRRTDLRFAIGENVLVTPQVRHDGTAFASEAYVLGAGEGSSMVRGFARRESPRLRRVSVLSDPSVRQASLASSMAWTEATWRSRIENLESIIVRDTDMAPIGSIELGDEIYLTGQGGWVEIDDWYRVLSIRVNTSVGEAMELTVRRADRLV